MSFPSIRALALTGHPLILCGRPWAQGLISQFEPAQFVPLSGQFFSDRQAINTIANTTRNQALGLVLPDSLSSAALFRFAGIKSAGYQDDGRTLLLGWPIKKPSRAIHAVEKWWHLTRQALHAWSIESPVLTTADTAPAPVGLRLDESDRQTARENLTAHGLAPGQFVLLAPTATGSHRGKAKVWPYFAQLAQSLKTHGIAVATCPPSHEREQAKRACPDAVLLDPMPLKDFCALTQLAKLVVCNDSGVSHLAALAGANQLTLFGVTDPATTRPWSTKAQLLGEHDQWPTAADVLTTALKMMDQASEPKPDRI